MKWHLDKSTTAYQGFFRIDAQQFTIDTFAGQKLQLQREVFARGACAAVLAYDAKVDALVMVEQFRAGAIGSKSAWLIELIAGIIEPGESPTEVVIREAQEEAGCSISKPILIAEYLASPGGSSEHISIYAALCDSSSLPEYAGLAHEGEDIKVHIIARCELLAMLRAGAINNAMTLIAAQWLALNFASWQAADFGSF